jgi:hypothetical protein
MTRRCVLSSAAFLLHIQDCGGPYNPTDVVDSRLPVSGFSWGGLSDRTV